jgi:hypothetical protein
MSNLSARFVLALDEFQVLLFTFDIYLICARPLLNLHHHYLIETYFILVENYPHVD